MWLGNWDFKSQFNLSSVCDLPCIPVLIQLLRWASYLALRVVTCGRKILGRKGRETQAAEILGGSCSSQNIPTTAFSLPLLGSLFIGKVELEKAGSVCTRSRWTGWAFLKPGASSEWPTWVMGPVSHCILRHISKELEWK